MFKYPLLNESNAQSFILNFLSMLYVTMVVLSIILFDQILNFSVGGMQIQLSGSLVPYVFLYPISFIALRIYGLRQVHYMIGSMVLVSLIFVVISTVVASVSSNATGVHSILMHSFKMYIAGFIGMPAGIYSSFLAIKYLEKTGVHFGVLSLCVATIVGEIVNTIIVFPIGFHGEYSVHEIFSSIIVDALLFKVIAGVLLAILAMAAIQCLLQKRINCP